MDSFEKSRVHKNHAYEAEGSEDSQPNSDAGALSNAGKEQALSGRQAAKDPAARTELQQEEEQAGNSPPAGSSVEQRGQAELMPAGEPHRQDDAASVHEQTRRKASWRAKIRFALSQRVSLVRLVKPGVTPRVLLLMACCIAQLAQSPDGHPLQVSLIYVSSATGRCCRGRALLGLEQLWQEGLWATLESSTKGASGSLGCCTVRYAAGQHVLPPYKL